MKWFDSAKGLVISTSNVQVPGDSAAGPWNLASFLWLSPTLFISLPHGFHSCFHIAHHVYFLMCEWMTTSTPFQHHWSHFLCGERASLRKSLTGPALGAQLIDSVWFEMVSWLITSVLHLSISRWVIPGSVKSLCVLKTELKTEWFTGEDRLNWTGPAHTQRKRTLTSLT